MAALTALALAAGAASMAYGVYDQAQGRNTAQQGYALQQQGSQIQAQAAQQQAGISKEQAASSVVFAGQERDINLTASQQSLDASNKSFGINQGIISNEQAVEAQKAQAMELDARRQQLEVIRNQQRGRALAITNATSQGAQKGSGLQGGYGQVSGQSGVNALGIQQNLQIGENIFGLNSAISGGRIAENSLEHTYAIQQAANQTGKANLTYQAAQSSAGYQTRLADTQTLMSQGQGLVNQGSGIVSQGQMQMQTGSQFISAGPQIFSTANNADKLFSGSSSNFWFGDGSPQGYGGGSMKIFP